MTPARLSLIKRLATNLDAARAQHRGRTVPAICEGGSFDGRAHVAGDADGFRVEPANDDYPRRDKGA